MSEIIYRVYDLEDDTQYIKSCLENGTDLLQALAQLEVMQQEALQKEYNNSIRQMLLEESIDNYD